MLYVYHQVVVNVQLISLMLLDTMSQAVAVSNWKIIIVSIICLLILGSCPPKEHQYIVLIAKHNSYKFVKVVYSEGIPKTKCNFLFSRVLFYPCWTVCLAIFL